MDIGSAMMQLAGGILMQLRIRAYDGRIDYVWQKPKWVKSYVIMRNTHGWQLVSSRWKELS